MEYVGTESLKKAYAQTLIENNLVDRGIQVHKKDWATPIFEGYALHPESEPLKDDINSCLTEIGIDIVGLNKEFSYLSKKYSALINNAKERLNIVEEKIKKEETRIRDLNIICSRYSQFDSIIGLAPESVSSDASSFENTFTAKLKETKRGLVPTILDIQGNGEEKDEKARSNLVDNDPLTSWTYIKRSSKKNKSEESIICTITLHSKETFNTIKIQTDNNIVIEDVQTSNDNGLTYVSNMPREIHVNDERLRYDDPDYIYEAGIIAFPFTNFAKIRVRKKGKSLTLDNITIEGSSYATGTIVKNSIISTPVESIAVCANEYVPPHFPDDNYIEYVLTVNGKDYNIVPLNSHRQGIKIVRFANYSEGNNHTVHINETIKRAKLKVIIRTARDGETPYVSNLKVCLGKAGM